MTEKSTLEPTTLEPAATTPTPTPTPKKKRRRKFGDRKDGRRVRTATAMTTIMPYIMARRSSCTNNIAIWLIRRFPSIFMICP